MEVVGQRLKRYDGLAHVAGQTKFIDDLVVPGTLTVKAFRSPVIKGTIRRIDITKAEKLAGVAAVITYRDIPNNAYGMIPDQPVLAEEDVRYKGMPIAAVAAVDEDTAMEALEQIKVDIEEQDYVLDPIEAMKPGAPKVRPEGNLYIYDGKPYRQIVFGDVESGFKKSDHILETEYFHPSLEHAPMETQISLAVPDANGRLALYTVSQAHSIHLQMLCKILQMPMSKVRLMSGSIGGNFGGKNDIQTDHITALLALKTGRPAKWRWTREEELLYSTHRGALYVTMKDGVSKSGQILARRIKAIRDAGAYNSLNPFLIDKYSFQATGPYFIPNVYIEGYCVYTNRPPASAMRGFGVTTATFTTEVQMNKIAVMLGKDPWEIRFMNAYRTGDQMHTRRVLDSVSLIESMQALAKKVGIELSDKLKAMTSAAREDGR
jgi:CO/xanthine dehydrogenase Mo-binding subunit